jgi:hypothetical protein
MLLMDIKATNKGMEKGRLVKGMKVGEMDGDLIQWIVSCASESTLEMMIKANDLDRCPVGVVVPQA